MKIKPYRPPSSWSESVSADEQSFTMDRALADELGIDQASREWQLLSQTGTFWSKYRNTRGQLYPFYETESQLDSLRSRCRVLGQVFPQAITAMDALTDYTVATGFKFEVQPRDNRVSKGFCQECDKVVEEFLDRVNWVADLDRELFSTARVDGDQACAVYDIGMGHADVRLIPSEFVTEPNDPRKVERWLGMTDPGSWSFGIHTDAHDFQKVYGYYVQWSPEPGDFDYFQASDVEFLKHNVRRNVKRGLSDFHAVLAWLVRSEKLMRSTAIGSTLQASIAWVEEYAEGVTQADAETVALGGANYTYEVPSQGGGQTRYATQFEAGSVVGLGKGLKYQPGPLGSERNPNFLLVSAAITRLIGARWSMPEYLISGDASNANYSSTMVAESPWVKATKARQFAYGRTQSNILMRVLGIALRAGRLRNFQVRSLDDLRCCIKIVAKGEQVEVRDKNDETDRRKVLSDAGLLSDQTWSEEEGLDHEEEMRRGAKKAPPPNPLLPGQDPNDPSATPGADGKLPTAKQLVQEMWRGYP